MIGLADLVRPPGSPTTPCLIRLSQSLMVTLRSGPGVRREEIEAPLDPGLEGGRDGGREVARELGRDIL